MKPILVTLCFTCAAFAQAPDMKSLTGPIKANQNQVKTNIVRSAEKMPEENYNFKPTPDVRSFGELIGHVADAQYLFCSASLNEKSPALNIEKSKHTKAELTAALSDAFAYCDKAYAAFTDANAAEPLKFFGSERSRNGVLAFNAMHNFEHYGNIVTYMRLKGLVPPSSEPKK